MPDYREIILAIFTAINSVAVYLAHKKLKENGTTPAHSTDEVWTEILDLRATQQKILQGMNKWLRKHGRTIQAEALAEGVEIPVSPRVKKSGMIMPNGNRGN